MTQDNGIRSQENQSGSSVNEPPVKLEFKPDQKRLVRLAHFRRVTLWITFLLLAVSLVWLIMFPPKWSQNKRQNLTQTSGKRPMAETTAPSEKKPSTALGMKENVEDEIITQALVSGRLIDSSVNIAFAQWKRASALVYKGEANKSKIEEMLGGINAARLVSESAKSMVEVVRREMEKLRGMSRSPGWVGLRVNAIYGAAREYWNFVTEVMVNQEAFFAAWEKAVDALKDGNVAEFEIKGNVATGYLRKSESCQRKFYRAQARLKEMLKIGTK